MFKIFVVFSLTHKIVGKSNSSKQIPKQEQEVSHINLSGLENARKEIELSAPPTHTTTATMNDSINANNCSSVIDLVCKKFSEGCLFFKIKLPCIRNNSFCNFYAYECVLVFV